MTDAKRPKRRRHNAKGRSVGEPQYMKLPYSMTRSSAWRGLSGPALKVLIELKGRFNGFNNGDLSLSLDEAVRLLGMSKSTAQRAFNELVDRGFLIVSKPGQWYGRLATTYIMTDKSLRGQLATNDWQQQA